MLDLQPPANTMLQIAEGVTDEQLDGPTPCTETDVRGLLSHVLMLSVAFRDAARKVEGPTTTTPPTDAAPPSLPADWREQLGSALTGLVEAWREPGATDGETVAGGVRMPAAIMNSVASNELLVHGWDLARATGQPFEAAPENLQSSYDFCSQTPDGPEARQGLFGPVVPVPDDAPLLDRTLGFAGRNPHWTPTR